MLKLHGRQHPMRHQCVRMLNKEVHYFTYRFGSLDVSDYEQVR